jgi:hypothetical protein
MGKRASATSAFLLLLVCALAGSMLSSRPVSRADDTSIGATGGTVYPVRSTDVRLEAETVQATCFGSFVEYRVDFRFVNEGKARTIKLGFPFNYADYFENDTEQPVGFQAWQDGRPLEVRVVPASYNDRVAKGGFFAHTARFAPGPTTITVSYLAQSSGSARGRRTGVEPGDPRFGMASWYEYWLHSGSTWKGPIGEVVVRYRLAESFTGLDVELTAADADEGVPVTAPSGWTTPLPRTYQWRFVDFDPTPSRDSDWWQPVSPYDVTLGFASPMQDQAAATWRWSSAAGCGVGEEVWYWFQDGDLDSHWAEGVGGPGTGEWVEARFTRPRHVRELRILPGNNAYLAAFTKYARPKTLRAVFSDGSSTLLHLKDAPALQRFPVDVTTRTVRLTIESVYLGTDYPATCISEVEFGTQVAPGYASFADLLANDDATGRLPSWAGPPAPAPNRASRDAEWREVQDAEAVACGDLIGVNQWVPFPADEAPFKEPAELGDIEDKASPALLPEEDLVGGPMEVNALSYRTYEIRYDSGIDLLVNTDLSRGSTKSVLAELSDEAGSCAPYEDGRRLPYDVQSIGSCIVGVARPGVIEEECACPGESGRVPGQVFWRDGAVSYHLYARTDDVTIEKLVEVATSLIDPSLLRGAAAADSRANRTARGWAVTLAAIAVVAAMVAVVVRRRKASTPPADG